MDNVTDFQLTSSENKIFKVNKKSSKIGALEIFWLYSIGVRHSLYYGLL